MTADASADPQAPDPDAPVNPGQRAPERRRRVSQPGVQPRRGIDGALSAAIAIAKGMEAAHE